MVFSARALCREEVGADGAPAFAVDREDAIPIVARLIEDMLAGRGLPTKRTRPWIEAAVSLPVECWAAVAEGRTPARLDGPELKATALDLCKKVFRARLREEVSGPMWFVWGCRGDERFLPMPGVKSRAPSAVVHID